MKYAYAFIMVNSLISIAALLILAIGYADPDNGTGLHPVIACIGCAFQGAVGYWAASHLEFDLET
jgi:hypothetical protein